MSASAARDDTRISGPGDVARALTVVRERAAQRTVTADLRQPVGTAADETVQESLAVPAGLQRLLPTGLSAGSTIAVGTGQGATSLLIAALSRATIGGQWVGVVGLPQLNLAAVAEAGADLERVAVVPDPRELWSDVIAALCDGLALVAFAVQASVLERTVRADRAGPQVRLRTDAVRPPVGGRRPDP